MSETEQTTVIDGEVSRMGNQPKADGPARLLVADTDTDGTRDLLAVGRRTGNDEGDSWHSGATIGVWTPAESMTTTNDGYTVTTSVASNMATVDPTSDVQWSNNTGQDAGEVDRASSLQWVPDTVANGLDATGNMASEVWTPAADTVASVGVFAPASKRDHLWKPGQSGNPLGRGKSDLAMLHAIAKEFQPDEVIGMVRSAWSSAVTRNTSKGKMEVIRFIIEYIVGNPRQYVSTVKGSPEQWLQALASVQLPGSEDTTDD